MSGRTAHEGTSKKRGHHGTYSHRLGNGTQSSHHATGEKIDIGTEWKKGEEGRGQSRGSQVLRATLEKGTRRKFKKEIHGCLNIGQGR